MEIKDCVLSHVLVNRGHIFGRYTNFPVYFIPLVFNTRLMHIFCSPIPFKCTDGYKLIFLKSNSDWKILCFLESCRLLNLSFIFLQGSDDESKYWAPFFCFSLSVKWVSFVNLSCIDFWFQSLVNYKICETPE